MIQMDMFLSRSALSSCACMLVAPNYHIGHRYLPTGQGGQADREGIRILHQSSMMALNYATGFLGAVAKFIIQWVACLGLIDLV